MTMGQIITPEQREKALRSLQRQIEMMENTIRCIYPEHNDATIHFAESGNISLRVAQWDDWDIFDPPRKGEMKRRYLMDCEYRDGKWSLDNSEETNSYYRERGILLEERKEARESA